MTPAPRSSIAAQLRQHAVALISLALAITSLAYNTWRNETTEAHRNVRHAAFRTLEELGELQVIVDARQYQGDLMRGDYVSGWARVLLIDDLSSVLPSQGQNAAAELHDAWAQNFEGWDSRADTAAGQRISATIARTRSEIRQVLTGLE